MMNISTTLNNAVVQSQPNFPTINRNQNQSQRYNAAAIASQEQTLAWLQQARQILIHLQQQDIAARVKHWNELVNAAVRQLQATLRMSNQPASMAPAFVFHPDMQNYTAFIASWNGVTAPTTNHAFDSYLQAAMHWLESCKYLQLAITLYRDMVTCAVNYCSLLSEILFKHDLGRRYMFERTLRYSILHQLFAAKLSIIGQDNASPQPLLIEKCVPFLNGLLDAYIADCAQFYILYSNNSAKAAFFQHKFNSELSALKKSYDDARAQTVANMVKQEADSSNNGNGNVANNNLAMNMSRSHQSQSPQSQSQACTHSTSTNDPTCSSGSGACPDPPASSQSSDTITFTHQQHQMVFFLLERIIGTYQQQQQHAHNLNNRIQHLERTLSQQNSKIAAMQKQPPQPQLQQPQLQLPLQVPPHPQPQPQPQPHTATDKSANRSKRRPKMTPSNDKNANSAVAPQIMQQTQNAKTGNSTQSDKTTLNTSAENQLLQTLLNLNQNAMLSAAATGNACNNNNNNGTNTRCPVHPIATRTQTNPNVNMTMQMQMNMNMNANVTSESGCPPTKKRKLQQNGNETNNLSNVAQLLKDVANNHELLSLLLQQVTTNNSSST